MEVGDNSAAGEGSFGSVKGHRVAGAWLKVGQLVLLLVAFNKESISCHWKTEVKLTFYYRFTTFTPSHASTVFSFVSTYYIKFDLFEGFLL